ncbi:MAG: hypothetical protein U5L45_06150 [Saprospiraceae bacterium]|nr:hypothetical protein [Saprospiraceae bacterium]
MKPYIKSKLLVIALASLAREGECGSFFGLCPKNEPHSPFARAKRAQKCLLMRILNLCMVFKTFFMTKWLKLNKCCFDTGSFSLRSKIARV